MCSTSHITESSQSCCWLNLTRVCNIRNYLSGICLRHTHTRSQISKIANRGGLSHIHFRHAHQTANCCRQRRQIDIHNRSSIHSCKCLTHFSLCFLIIRSIEHHQVIRTKRQIRWWLVGRTRRRLMIKIWSILQVIWHFRHLLNWSNIWPRRWHFSQKICFPRSSSPFLQWVILCRSCSRILISSSKSRMSLHHFSHLFR